MLLSFNIRNTHFGNSRFATAKIMCFLIITGSWFVFIPQIPIQVRTTLLNVIAQKLGLRRSTLYNRGTFFDDYLKFCDAFLIKEATSRSAIQKGEIITSDDVFDNMLRIRNENQAIDFERERFVKEFIERPIRKKNDPSCSQYVRSRLSRNHPEQSNGETAFNYFVKKITTVP